ncbi:hypothetical protein [Streptomyces sp. NPDC005283]|uniref:hypothetical protein n=1 Tax=Streptomyces sp. NPDC005283 TaxID=3156871 RepID=UPI003451FEDA
MWLNEGFATYAEWLWEEEQGGNTAQETFDSFYNGTHPESEGIWDFPPATPPAPEQVSDPPVYGRGAMTLHQLRKQWATRPSSPFCERGLKIAGTEAPSRRTLSTCAAQSPAWPLMLCSTISSTSRESRPERVLDLRLSVVNLSTRTGERFR